MLAALTGQRMLFNYLRIGGVNRDLNHDFLSRLGDWMSKAAVELEQEARLLNENEIFVRRTTGHGRPGPRHGAAAAHHRAQPARRSGVPYDVRRAHPYSVYHELDFDIPTRSEGDSYARYLLRVDEIRESIQIIDQVLHEMPDGPVMAKVPRLIRIPPGRAFIAVESPRGQYGCYAMSDGSDQPFRLRISDPSFWNLQAVGALMPGNLIADTMAIMASLDPVMGGVDK